MEKELYIKINKPSLKYAYYLYFDVQPYFADRLFIEHKIRVWFDRECSKKDSPYTAVFCHIKKRDVPVFLAALKDLKNRMILCGYPNYESEIGELITELGSNLQ